jgi:tetratricopeptide (TPR) repeat protein
LAERSERRRAKSEDFGKLEKQIAEYLRRKRRAEVSLHEATFRAERKAVSAEPAAATQGAGDASEADFYLDEVFEVSLDYFSRQQLARARQHYQQGRYAQAWKEFAAAVHADPQNATAAYYFAWALATCSDHQRRNGKLAVGYARLGCTLTDWKSWTHLLALAAAHAEAGEYDEAVRRLDEALELAPAEKRASYEYLRERFRNKLSYGRP